MHHKRVLKEDSPTPFYFSPLSVWDKPACQFSFFNPPGPIKRLIPVSVLTPVCGREILSRFFLMATKVKFLLSVAYSKNSYPASAPILFTRDSGCRSLILQEFSALGLIFETSIPGILFSSPGSFFFFFWWERGECNELVSVLS